MKDKLVIVERLEKVWKRALSDNVYEEKNDSTDVVSFNWTPFQLSGIFLDPFCQSTN